jgi:hypothetical protein
MTAKRHTLPNVDKSPGPGAWIALAALLAALGAAVFGVFVWFDSVSAQVKVPLVTGVATVLVALITVVSSRYLDRRQQIQQAIRERKLPIYERFVSALLLSFQSGNEPTGEEGNPELVAAFLDFSREVVVWGSDEIVTAWSSYVSGWRKAKTDQERMAMTLGVEDLLIAIRKECGHKGPLASRTLLGLFITDLDDVLASVGPAVQEGESAG